MKAAWHFLLRAFIAVFTHAVVLLAWPFMIIIVLMWMIADWVWDKRHPYNPQAKGPQDEDHP